MYLDGMLGFSFFQVWVNYIIGRGEAGLMYVGLDVHKLVCYGTVMTHDGEVVKRARFNNDPEGLREVPCGCGGGEAAGAG